MLHMEIRVRRLAAVFTIPFAVLLAGCDPIAGVALRQPLAPAPQVDCVRAALAASPLVSRVGPSTYDKALPGYQFQLLLRDSVAPERTMPPMVRLLVPARDDDRVTLEVFISYFGATTSSITPESAQRLAGAARVVTRLVRDACAPGSPPDATCRIEGFGPSRLCPPAA